MAKVIKNASLEEIERLKKQNVIQPEPISSLITENNKTAINNSVSSILNPKRSIFEPEPVHIKLASLGLTLDSNLVDNHGIYIRRFTIKEEQNFIDGLKKIQTLQKSTIEFEDYQKINSILDNVLDSCIMTQISFFELPAIDKFVIFAKIVELTYNEIRPTVECKNCHSIYTISIKPYSDFKILYVPKNMQFEKIIKLTSYEGDIKWHIMFPTVQYSNALLDLNIINAIQATTKNIEGYIIVNGEKIEIMPEHYVDILTNLNNKDRSEYESFINTIGNYGLQMTTQIAFCENTKCSLYHKPQEIEFPHADIFAKILNSGIIK